MNSQNVHYRQPRILHALLFATVVAATPAPTMTGLAHRLVAPVHPPFAPTVAVIRSLSPYCTLALRIPVGPPAAILSVVAVDPVVRTITAPRNAGLAVDTCSGKLRSVPPAKGTILLLPGYGMPKAALLPYSTALAAKGYRAVLVDLRAQGESTGAHLGYGKQEARDLVQVLHYLRQHGFLAGKVGLLGISYGAAVALDTAAVDDQIRAVVAVAPFARVDPTIRRFLDMSDPQQATTISPRLLRQAIKRAGRLVGYPLTEADPMRAVSAIRAPVLYLAGAKDPVAPLRDVQALASKTPHSQIIIEAQKNHLTLTSDVPLIVKSAILWFERYLKTSPDRASLPGNQRDTAPERRIDSTAIRQRRKGLTSDGEMSSNRAVILSAHPRTAKHWNRRFRHERTGQ